MAYGTATGGRDATYGMAPHAVSGLGQGLWVFMGITNVVWFG